MPDILDEIAMPESTIVHGLRHVIVTFQKIRPTQDDGGKFPTELIGKPLSVISVYPEEPSIESFYLNTKQIIEYLKNPNGRKIDVYGPTQCCGIKQSESNPGKLHVPYAIEGKKSFEARLDLTTLRQCIDSVQKEYPEIIV